MKKVAFEVIVAVALTLGAILTWVPGVRANDVVVIGAFARASASPAATGGAVYFEIRNAGDSADRLVSLSTEAAASASIHETVTEGDVAKMNMVEAVDIPPRASIMFKPGGLHVMLMGLKSPLKKGGNFLLEFTFQHAGKIAVTVPVGGVGDQAPPSGG